MTSNPSQQLARLLRETRPAPIEVSLRAQLAGLDRVLGTHGLAVGQITEWVGDGSSGKTGALRALVSSVRRRGIAVAWIDGRQELVAADWLDPGAAAPLWVVRPPHEAEASFCAEVLLRARAFGVVVLEGGGPLVQSMGVRLQRLARQGAAALVRIRAPDDAASSPVVQRLTFTPTPPPAPRDPLAARAPLVWPIQLRRTHGGGPAEGTVQLIEPACDRLTAHPIGPDRPAGRTHAGARYGIA